ncbi:MAG: hypothetical protein EOO47_15270 [Flavobacterium sp.]|nr:MAG: hypothetical protein EOO47_15270 [Flavobacterium sp.]
MKEILKSKIAPLHFLIVFLIAFILCGFVWFFAIPLIYWSAFGEGAEAARIDELPINVFIENYGALIIVLILCLFRIFNNYKRQRLSCAKSYLLTFILISVLYIFKIPIAELIIGAFN